MMRGYHSTNRCDNCNSPRSAAERCEHEFLCAPCIEAENEFNERHADNE